MRKYYVILSVALVSLSVNIAIASQPSIEEILAYTPERQFEYLTMPSPEANAYYKNNSGEYSRLLVEIAASDIGASEIAMYILNNHILLLLSNKYSPAYNELIQSIIIEKKLSQIILMPYKDLKTKRGAILAHANLYPPNEELLQLLNTKSKAAYLIIEV